MSCKFDQNRGINQTVLMSPYGTAIQLPISFAGWINIAEAGGLADQYVIGCFGTTAWIPSTNGYKVTITPATGSQYHIRGMVHAAFFGPAVDYVQSSFVNLGEWVHFAFVVEGSGTTATLWKIYINGVLDNTKVPTLSPAQVLNNVVIGGESPTSTTELGFRNCAHRLTFYHNRALTDAEIAEMATGEDAANVQPADIFSNVPLDDATSVTTNLAGANFTLYDDLPDYTVVDCLEGDSPTPPVVTPDTGPLNLTFSLYRDDNFRDWGTADTAGPGECFSSYLDTFYHMLDDTMLWMQAPYIYTYLQNTSRNGRDPSLLLQPRWEWSEDELSHKFSRQMQVYDFKQDQTVSNTKNRVRGTGRALRLHFSSECEMDFNLLGWGIMLNKNERY